MKQEQWKEASRPGHIVFFTSDSLKRTLERTGYGDCKRLHWIVKYNAGALRRGVQYLLQASSMDGELRYLAYKKPVRTH